MAEITNIRVVDFGTAFSGLTDVRYTVFDTNNNIITRTSGGVSEVSGGTGIYRAEICFSASFSGSLVWDAPETSSTIFATEEYNFLNVNPAVNDIDTRTTTMATQLTNVSSSVDKIQQIQEGRWRITGNQMIIFAPDNSTELFRFDLFDSSGSPTNTSVFDRQRT